MPRAVTRGVPISKYAFKHALTQQVACETLLQERRRALHARIVEQAIDLRLALRTALRPLGDFGRILAYLREAEALALAEELGMQPLVAHCHLGLGKLYVRIGRRAEARAALTAAVVLYRTMEMTFWLPQVEAVLAQVV